MHREADAKSHQAHRPRALFQHCDVLRHAIPICRQFKFFNKGYESANAATLVEFLIERAAHY